MPPKIPADAALFMHRLHPMPALVAMLLASLFVFGCGDDDSCFKPKDYPFRQLTTIENVIYNFALCFDKMDYDHMVPLIHDDFTYVFDENDVTQYPDYIPQDGTWNRSEWLDAMQKMFNSDYVPCDPDTKIDSVRLDMELSGAHTPSNAPEAPPGTREGFVTLDLRVNTVGELTYLVNSRPLFFFAPDSSKTPVTWTVWRIEDAPFSEPLRIDVQDISAGALIHADSAILKARTPVMQTSAGLQSEPLRLGLILALYARSCS